MNEDLKGETQINSLEILNNYFKDEEEDEDEKYFRNISKKKKYIFTIKTPALDVNTKLRKIGDIVDNIENIIYFNKRELENCNDEEEIKKFLYNKYNLNINLEVDRKILKILIGVNKNNLIIKASKLNYVVRNYENNINMKDVNYCDKELIITFSVSIHINIKSHFICYNEIINSFKYLNEKINYKINNEIQKCIDVNEVNIFKYKNEYKKFNKLGIEKEEFKIYFIIRKVNDLDSIVNYFAKNINSRLGDIFRAIIKIESISYMVDNEECVVLNLIIEIYPSECIKYSFSPMIENILDISISSNLYFIICYFIEYCEIRNIFIYNIGVASPFPIQYNTKYGVINNDYEMSRENYRYNNNIHHFYKGFESHKRIYYIQKYLDDENLFLE